MQDLRHTVGLLRHLQEENAALVKIFDEVWALSPG